MKSFLSTGTIGVKSRLGEQRVSKNLHSGARHAAVTGSGRDEQNKRLS
ncbi:hypothetical protein [Limimaricola cinnabarinus]|jgi:hypothetical protein|nr:hypothetical protein [Limimaricola cinnabarinus]